MWGRGILPAFHSLTGGLNRLAFFGTKKGRCDRTSLNVKRWGGSTRFDTKGCIGVVRGTQQSTQEPPRFALTISDPIMFVKGLAPEYSQNVCSSAL